MKSIKYDMKYISIKQQPRIDENMPIDLRDYVPYPNNTALGTGKMLNYPQMINFSKKIGGSVYVVSSHFSDESSQTVLGQFKKLVLTEKKPESEVPQI